MKHEFKIVAEKISRGRVFRRRLPATVGGGPIFVTPEAGLRYWLQMSQCDPDLLNAARQWIRRGDVIWDVGANVGLFTFAAAGLTGTNGSVLAIEADIWLSSLLRRSERLRWPGRAPVEVLPVAVSNTLDIAQFEIAQRARASNHLWGHGSSQAGGRRESQSVVTITLDWLLQKRPAPQVLKIDVEGAEVLVLEGASQLLTQARPVVFCEVFADNVEVVSKCFKDCDYFLFDMSATPGNRRVLEKATWNTLACPIERLPHNMRSKVIRE